MDRKYLRKKVVDLLKKAKIEGIDQDVFSQRSIPSSHEQLPVALVYINSENSRRFDEAPKRYLKDADVTIEIITTHDNDELLADEMDDLSLKVEEIIDTSIELEECTEYVNHTSSLVSTESEGSGPIGSVRTTFSIGYIFEPDRELILPDLKSVNNNWSMNGNEDGAQDQICLPGE